MMKNIVAVLFLGFILVQSNPLLPSTPPPLGPEYPQPNPPPPPPVVDGVVLPRLGAASVPLSFVDESDGKFYTGVVTLGGANYLPDNWPSLESASGLLEQQTGEVNFYRPESNDFEFDFPNLLNPRVFPVAVNWAGNIYVWGGGSNVLETFNLTSWEWEVVSSSNAAPLARFASAYAVVGDKLYIFGGFSLFGNSPFPGIPVVVYDFSNNEWSSTTGSYPPRIGASATVVDGVNVALYGGLNAFTQSPVDTLELYNTLYDNFTDVNAVNGPAVAFHLAWASGRYLYVTLGVGPVDFRTIFVLDIFSNEKEWEVLEVSGGNSHIHPSVASGFSYAQLGSTIYLFSGVRDTGALVDSYTLQADIWSIDTTMNNHGESANKHNFYWHRLRCLPSFVFNKWHKLCVLLDEHQCALCHTCTDSRPMRQLYVGYLKEKMLARDHSGILRQCPAIWRHSHWNGY